ncbi:hypothetical protein BCR36DRAFT_581858 [Piromyces finnis]|uniref:Uncharacterized protein n=1 Tax=Piromyces finnis TaxID=1754191 RepID=A0A1Y1VEH1_9FUNG|nr:hypothetical protein BCR36DRAFT_581858 [Piromyces finnis]|eukprot:ORX54227.1 hypothetical protein BCR36DRAFT_581858 [Piromyces finnis]
MPTISNNDKMNHYNNRHDNNDHVRKTSNEKYINKEKSPLKENSTSIKSKLHNDYHHSYKNDISSHHQHHSHSHHSLSSDISNHHHHHHHQSHSHEINPKFKTKLYPDDHYNMEQDFQELDKIIDNAVNNFKIDGKKDYKKK